MVIQHNISALDASRHLNRNRTDLNKNLEKLSSGYKINRAGDDAAGLAVSESMRNKLKGLDQAKSNAEDGINLIQTAEGALTEVHAMLERGTTLATQAANGTYTDDVRKHIDKEFQELKGEIDRISGSTDYNGINLLNGLQAAGNINTVTRVLSDDEIDAQKELVKNLVGNSGESILNSFSSLSSGFPSTDVDITLKSLSGSTLANAAGTYKDTGRGDIDINVDLDKIDSIPTASYGSTIAHEMMHGVMGVALAKAGTSMSQLKSGDNLWFVEGTAQLAGGLFNAGWNLDIRNTAQAGGASAMRTTLANHESPTNEVYGTGALMTAYIGYLASDFFDGTIDIGDSDMRDGIQDGINKIFNEIINNHKSLEEAIQITTGRSESSIMSDFAGADSSSNFVNFCINVGQESGPSGAGSVVAGLDTAIENVVSTTTYSPGHFFMDEDNIDTSSYGRADEGVILQIGPSAEETISIMRFDMSSDGLGLFDSNVLTRSEASEAIGALKEAVENTSATRAYFGAKQNRLEHIINNLEITNENITNAESRIRDTDMADEISKYTKNNILMQAAQSMLAQANQSPQGILSLLG